MPDYSLGRAHGQIEITYDGRGADRAARDLDAVTDSSTAADKSLDKTQKTLRDTSREMDSAGDSAAGYQARLRDVERESRAVEQAERSHRNALLDSKATLDDIKAAEDEVTEAKKRHKRATDAVRDAERAMSDGMRVSRGAVSALVTLMPRLSSVLGVTSDSMGGLATTTRGAAGAASGLAGPLSDVTKLLALAGPQGRAAAAGIETATLGLNLLGNAVDGAVGALGSLAGFEVQFAKISGAILGLTSLGGLAGIGTASGVQGIINLAGAAQQLSGGLGLLPGVVSGVAFSMKTLEIAFHGVGDALTSMMDDDPTAFLESLKNMGPVAAQAMLSVAQFRDLFKAAGAFVQDSFFAQVADQIVPLIQTWLPAVTEGMGQVATVFGQAARELARLLMQPQAMATFQQFIADISAGLQAMLPALEPLLYIFQQLTVAGTGFFAEIGGSITQALNSLADIVEDAASSGRLTEWIQTGINAFGHMISIVYSLGSAFGEIMTIADKFGGGGLLGWLDELAASLDAWTQTPEGQKALTDFFTALREATDAFLPMLGPLLEGLMSIGVALTQAGVASAPGWQVFFETFAQTMAQLAPQIAATAPALNTFLVGLADAMAQLMAQIGPELPRIFQMMADAFVALLPQIGPLVTVFLDLTERVGPQLPKFFGAITALIEATLPFWPILIDFVRNFVSVLTWFIESGATVIGWFTKFLEGLGSFVTQLPDALGEIGGAIERFFAGLPDRARTAGQSLISGLVDGITNGLGSLSTTAKTLVEAIAKWLQSSPAEVGPFSGDGYTLVRGRKMVTDMAAGMRAAQPDIAAAAAATAAAASAPLSSGAPAPTGRETSGGALLPDHIAGADTSILTEYLRHQFSDTHGLKGLAADFGDMLDLVKGGFDLLNTHAVQPMLDAMGMIPRRSEQSWRKRSAEEIAAEQQQESERKSLEEQRSQGPTWDDVLGPGQSSDTGNPLPGATVPLVQNPDGTWTSPNEAWAHLIARESGGINQRQQIIDANSGGNEAEGIFQITPATWRAHGGEEFAPNPLVASVQEQAAIAARILQANPSGSDWGAGLPGRENAQELLSGLTNSSDTKRTVLWGEVLGQPESATYGLPAGTDTGGYGTGNADTFPDWVMALADHFGVLPSTYAGHQETDRHEPGYAPNPEHENRGIDWSGPVESMQALADYLATVPGALEQVIWRNPETGQTVSIAGGQPVSGYYDEETMQGHENHVHTRQSTPIPLPGGPTSVAERRGVGAAAGDDVVLPSGKRLSELAESTDKSATVNEQLLQAYLQGNPALAQQLEAARAPGVDDATVLNALNSVSTTISDLTEQDPLGNKNAIDALRSEQNAIAKQQGFTQQQAVDPMQIAQGIASGAGSAVTGAFQIVQDVLDSMAATQDIADHLVYGIRNTDDINKIIDNVQKYVTLAGDIYSQVGNILGMVGGIVGAAAGADPSGGASGAAAGLSAAGSITQLIGGWVHGANAIIDYGQQIYDIAMTYVGRFMTSLTGMGGAEMMGNVGFLLNKNTGQLLSYSQDNPQHQSAMEVPSWIKDAYGYGRGNPNPQVNQQLHLYAGPGQSIGDAMNDFVWLINTQGTSGALAPAAF